MGPIAIRSMECSDARSSLCLAGGRRQASFEADRMAVRHPGAAALPPPPSGTGIRGRSPGHGPPAHPRSLPSPACEDRKILFGECRGSFACVRASGATGWSDPSGGRSTGSGNVRSWYFSRCVRRRPILTEWQRSMQLWPVRRQAVVPLCPAISGPTCRQHVLSSLTSFRDISHAEAE